MKGGENACAAARARSPLPPTEGWAGEAIPERLCLAMEGALASPTRTELLVVDLAALGPTGSERRGAFLEQQAIASVSVDQNLADAATVAYQPLGDG